MAALTNVRARVDDMFVLEAPCVDWLLPPMYPDGPVKHDDAFAVNWIAVPVQPYAPREVLSIFINNQIAFSWPIEDLVRRYRRSEEVAPAPLLVEVHDCLATISKRLAHTLQKDLSSSLVPSEQTVALSALLKGYAEAVAAYGTDAGVPLRRWLTIVPRAWIRAETSKGSPLRIHLRGIRSYEL